eukprot:CAMPEP_0205940794 /NCGR_PEP_ID=MMETSP1325-20131115/53226_1 /ASSEMBLY_ACC=CAM_ASM_000708 /TAXON_ID=236786 /ORGANISM="Florenciella sp., Strain RCC1007" /LENGTH=61 /DNA_ID=CAMNT_0053311373 /DNA_START=85 /DNA_END=267 /DNA_ORIENTATION=-
MHPCTVWCAVALPDGDFATAGQDGVVRIFTKDPSKAAPPEAQAAFVAQIEEARAKQKASQN